ncbi:MAG: hypothetical protein M3250_06920 [Thermoproteota archaeon]|nr:hypothetical protein [Thermoproteota archaeon]
MLIGALVVIPPGLAMQEAMAQGPPAKAQTILAPEPSDRGAVASSGHGGCDPDVCG